MPSRPVHIFSVLIVSAAFESPIGNYIIERHIHSLNKNGLHLYSVRTKRQFWFEATSCTVPSIEWDLNLFMC